MTTVAPTETTPAAGKPSGESQAVSDADIAEAIDGAYWFGKSLVVADREKIDRRIRRRNLSASTSDNVTGCAARFAIDSMLPRVVNPLGAAELGSGAHSILEHFYEREPEKRTLTNLRRHVKPVTREQIAALEGTPQYDDVFAEVSKTIGDWAERIYALENPQEVKVFKTELEMKGLTLSNGVPFVGYLDRTRYEGDLDDWDNVILHIDDYKFGKKVKRPSQRFGDHYGDQMRLYFDAIEQKYGKQAGSATLLWPRQGQRVPADLSRPAVRATLASFSRAWDYMNSVADAATFPAVPSALCGWCPAVNSCPVAMVKTDNAKASAATQHGGANGPVALGIPTVREFVAPPRMDKTDGTVPAGQENTVTQTAPGANLLPFPNNKWAVMSVASLTDAAAAHLDIYGQVLSPPTINALANTLGGIVVDVHKAVFMGGFDWSFDSASRVVYSLNASLRSRPAPFGQDEAAWEKWRGTLVGLTAAKLRIAIPMVDVTEFGAADFGVLIAKTTVPPKAEVEAAAEPEPALV